MKLRVPGFLRLLRSLESIARSLATLADIEQAKWNASHQTKKPRATEFAVLDIGESERRYHKVREAMEAGVEPEL